MIRVRIRRFLPNPLFISARFKILHTVSPFPSRAQSEVEQMIFLFHEYVRYHPDLPDNLDERFIKPSDPFRMIDFVARHLTEVKIGKLQKVLETQDARQWFHEVTELLKTSLAYLRLRQELDQKIEENLMRNQREYYLQEKLKILNQELGESLEEESPDIQKLHVQIQKANLPAAAQQLCNRRFGKVA